ncbi:ribosome biogenesis GTP-binding protein YihA/YsxC [Taibaiella soli]|uniref:Probable GTP-binding protein EngB n=1 Tax=Taibaiella soli TaxID=1649169 RepID=A0A2W2A856_9BACT|nr:ribosome biogenesis GTP-binding protein YihA/YsxC [Taibaiella soli]PZF71535.1 YihA family ribosome biogenesis GTP-binding protein [Taibaiella soli]
MEIRSAKYLISSPKVEDCPKPDKPEYAFIGRSNVGKSSLINMLTRQTKLAKTSSSPGKTQLINHFVINHSWYLVDLPGYGYAKVSQKQRAEFQKMISNYLTKRENLMTVFVLVDSRLKPQQLDLDFMAQLGEWGVPFSIVFTKADKSTQREVAKNAKQFIEKMKEEWQFIPRSFVTSAEKFHGRKEMLAYIEEVNEEWGKEPEQLS